MKNERTLFLSPSCPDGRIYMKRVIILAALAFAMLTGTVGITGFPSTQTMASPDDSCSVCEDGCGACQ
jgi:hypothetical protein